MHPGKQISKNQAKIPSHLTAFGACRYGNAESTGNIVQDGAVLIGTDEPCHFAQVRKECPAAVAL